MKKIIKLSYTLIISVVLVIVLNTLSLAKTVIYSFSEMCKKADLIVIGQVLETNTFLLTENTAIIEPSSVIKGIYEENTVKVRYGLPFYYAQCDTTNFVVGKEYVLFLRKSDNSYYAVGAHSGVYLIHDGKFVFKGSERKSIETFLELIKATINN